MGRGNTGRVGTRWSISNPWSLCQLRSLAHVKGVAKKEDLFSRERSFCRNFNNSDIDFIPSSLCLSFSCSRERAQCSRSNHNHRSSNWNCTFPINVVKVPNQEQSISPCPPQSITHLHTSNFPGLIPENKKVVE